MMETVLIWSCGVAVALLTVAVATVLSVRFRKGLGVAVLLLSVLGWLSVFLLLAVFSVLAQARMAYVAGACFLGGGAYVVLRGRSGEPARALDWPLPRLGLLLGLAVLVLATSARNASVAAQQALYARRAELAGLEQLFQPAVPQPLNAQPLYARAYQKLVPLDAVPGARQEFEAVWGEQRATPGTALADWLRRNQRTLELAEQGTRLPGYTSLEDALWRSSSFGDNREAKIFRLEMARKGHDANMIDNQQSRRRMGDLLQTRSLQRALAGDAAGAAADANALWALADQTQSPWLRPERLTERLLAVPGFDAARLEIPAGDPFDRRLQALLIRAEHAWLTFMGALPRSSDSLDHLYAMASDLFWTRARLADEERLYDRLWEAAYAPPGERLQRLRAAEASVHRYDGTGPHVVDGIGLLLRDQAARDCARVGLALARYRRAHGTFPARLDELVPGELAEVPADPFDGAPLRFQDGVVSAHDARFTVR